MKKILFVIKVSKHTHQNLQFVSKRSSNMFSLTPISSFQHYYILFDDTGCKNLCELFRMINRVKTLDFPNLKFQQVFNKTKVKNTTGTKIISDTLLTNGLQVSFHTRKRVRYLQEKPEQSAFEETPVNENTYVLGMDPNNPGGCVAAGLSSKRSVQPSISFNLLRNECFDKAGVYDARHRLKWYTVDNGYTILINPITTAKTSHLTTAFEQLATFPIVLDVLFKTIF